MLLPNSRAEGEAPDYDPGVTGHYLKPLLERSTPAHPEEPHSGISKDRSSKPKPVRGAGEAPDSDPGPVGGPKPRRSSRAKSRGVDAEQPDLIPAK